MQGLNNLRLVGRSVRATPLLVALERQILVQLRPTLIHGPLRHYAQLRTVETLLRFGSDPLRLSHEISGESVHAIELVGQDSNLLLLKFLWNYDEAKCPNCDHPRDSISNACFMQCKHRSGIYLIFYCHLGTTFHGSQKPTAWSWTY